MSDARLKLAKFVMTLQNQCKIPHWSLAGESIIYASALSKKPVFGPRTNRLHKIIHFANKFHFTDIIIILVGLVEGLKIWATVKRESIFRKQSINYKTIFVGFGAKSEEVIVEDINQEIMRINEDFHKGAGLLGCPALSSLILLVVKIAFGHTSKYKTAVEEISTNQINFITSSATNIGKYAFYRLYWKMVKTKEIKEAIFIVPSISAFACVDDKSIKTTFIQHGLLSMAILMPAFNNIKLLTRDEQRYYQFLFPDINISRKKYLSQGNAKNRIMMFLSINIRSEERIPEALPLIKWAKKNDFIVVIRPAYPATPEQIKTLSLTLPAFILDDAKKSFEESLETWSPMAVVSWTSTGLATALDYGTLPISLYNAETGDRAWERTHPVIKEIMLYPMLKRFIFWSNDQERIIKALLYSDYFELEINKLRNASDDLLKNLKI
ncbi:MAG: hypothetical protein ACD_46C00367G0003 [uncultured bacterium]|nr:MAG: hypothetical protein ACD_46C00367G0003 [uncultured bacterium]